MVLTGEEAASERFYDQKMEAETDFERNVVVWRMTS